MVMPDGAAMIGLGISLFGAGFVVHSAFDGWIKLKRLEHQTRDASKIAPSAADAEIAARLARIEQIVETTAVEVERVAEAQRYVALQVADGRAGALSAGRSAERIITPH